MKRIILEMKLNVEDEEYVDDPDKKSIESTIVNNIDFSC